MCELGHRLLTGDRAPKLTDHALSLLAGAARGGEGRALARMAALTAAGAYVPQDWRAALGLLGDAAAAGDVQAQGQLASLLPDASPAVDWPSLAARVRLDDWLRPAAAESLHAKVLRAPHSCRRGLRVAHRARPRPAGARHRVRRGQPARRGPRDAQQHRCELRLRDAGRGAVPRAGPHVTPAACACSSSRRRWCCTTTSASRSRRISISST